MPTVTDTNRENEPSKDPNRDPMTRISVWDPCVWFCSSSAEDPEDRSYDRFPWESWTPNYYDCSWSQGSLDPYDFQVAEKRLDYVLRRGDELIARDPFPYSEEEFVDRLKTDRRWQERSLSVLSDVLAGYPEFQHDAKVSLSLCERLTVGLPEKVWDTEVWFLLERHAKRLWEHAIQKHAFRMYERARCELDRMIRESDGRTDLLK